MATYAPQGYPPQGYPPQGYPPQYPPQGTVPYSSNPMHAPPPQAPPASKRGSQGCVTFQVVLLVIVFLTMTILAGVATSVGWAKATYTDTSK
jgi:hypothetical protein